MASYDWVRPEKIITHLKILAKLYSVKKNFRCCGLFSYRSYPLSFERHVQLLVLFLLF